MVRALLPAVIRTLILWWVGTLLYWSWDNAGGLQVALDRLNGLRSFFNLAPVGPPLVTALNDTQALVALISNWSLWGLCITALAVGLGTALAELQVRAESRARDAQVAKSATWRGAACSLGPLPQPPGLQRVVAPMPPTLQEVESPHREFLQEVCSTLAAYPTAYPGSDSSRTLHQHTVDTLIQAHGAGLAPLALCLLAARNLGNLTAYTQKEGGDWSQEKSIERESSRAASRLTSWYGLGEPGRNTLILALSFFNTPALVPLPGSNRESGPQAQELIRLATMPLPTPAPVTPPVAVPLAVTAPAIAVVAAPTAAPVPAVPSPDVPPPAIAAVTPTATPRLTVSPPTSLGVSAIPESLSPPVGAEGLVSVSAEQLPDLALQALLDVMPRIPFQVPGITKGTKAAAFKKGRRVYLLEAPFRERAAALISPEVQAALAKTYRVKGQPPLIAALSAALNREGWLVTRIEEMTVTAKHPLWRIRSGTSEFSGVLVMDFPEHLIDLLPTQNTTYDLVVLGAQVRQEDALDKGLMSSLLGSPLPPPAPARSMDSPP